jgi:hypothetical protein
LRVLVIGGLGYLGRRTAEALRAGGCEVIVGSSRSTTGQSRVHLDLRRPASLAALDGFDAVVDCADSLRAAPDAAIARVLEQGGAYFASTADGPTTERLLQRHRGTAGARGLAVLGAGLFPGFSNLLVAQAARGRAADKVELAVRVSALSGAGRGMAAIMADLVARRAVSAGPRLPIAGRARSTVRVDLPERALLRASLGARDVSVLLCPRPGILRPALLALSRLLPFRALLEPPLWLLRAGLLRLRKTPVDLIALADGQPRATLSVDDGVAATAYALAAAVLDADRWRGARGLRTADEVFTLGEQLAIAQRLSAGRVQWSLDAQAVSRVEAGTT